MCGDFCRAFIGYELVVVCEVTANTQQYFERLPTVTIIASLT